MATEFNQSGSKYLRELKGVVNDRVDVYAVLVMFDVKCPARQHAIKKLLCSGIRGKGDVTQDLKEARDAIDRAIQLAEEKPSSPTAVVVSADSPFIEQARAAFLASPYGPHLDVAQVQIVDEVK